jgi:hypothetical protein
MVQAGCAVLHPPFEWIIDGRGRSSREILIRHARMLDNVLGRMFRRPWHLNIKAELARIIESSSQDSESDVGRLNFLMQVLPFSAGRQGIA